jgi:hypothetical protein
MTPKSPCDQEHKDTSAGKSIETALETRRGGSATSRSWKAKPRPLSCHPRPDRGSIRFQSCDKGPTLPVQTSGDTYSPFVLSLKNQARTSRPQKSRPRAGARGIGRRARIGRDYGPCSRHTPAQLGKKSLASPSEVIPDLIGDPCVSRAAIKAPPNSGSSGPMPSGFSCVWRQSAPIPKQTKPPATPHSFCQLRNRLWVQPVPPTRRIVRSFKTPEQRQLFQLYETKHCFPAQER